MYEIVSRGLRSQTIIIFYVFGFLFRENHDLAEEDNPPKKLW